MNRSNLAFILIIQLFVSILIIGVISFNQIENSLNKKINSIKEDVNFNNNEWNLTKYNTDPQLLGSFPLYFITTDGFILDRRSPIHGFLDISDFNFLAKFQRTQSFSTITGQTRRVYSKLILYKDKPIGIVAVSYFNPQSSQLETIDAKLRTAMQLIYKKIKINDGEIKTGDLDERSIPYDIAFTIIDKYNTVIKKTTNTNSFKRIPSYIDPSYVKPFLKNNEIRIVQDQQTYAYFLLKLSQFDDRDHAAIGIVIVGESLTSSLKLIRDFIVYSVPVTILLYVCLAFLEKRNSKSKDNQNEKHTTASIIFDEKKSILFIDEKKFIIPYATNQFYLLQALFHKPLKRWETDELLERFGEDTNSGSKRKVYDAMIKINKKVYPVLSVKLIINQNKTYQLNSEIVPSS
ncbi:MAG TPA: hypothetical protein VG965_05265 [Patescibacteria group bacterium]|nr:hypothetical protein [Patescibacteria group bacterium]